MNAIGVDVNYTSSNTEVYYAFQQTGDFVWPNFIDDLEELLELPVRISLIYGDADYICNWFGGEAISLAANYSDADKFRAAGYAPMTVNGIEYGRPASTATSPSPACMRQAMRCPTTSPSRPCSSSTGPCSDGTSLRATPRSGRTTAPRGPRRRRTPSRMSPCRRSHLTRRLVWERRCPSTVDPLIPFRVLSFKTESVAIHLLPYM